MKIIYVAIITSMLCVLLFPCMQANKATYEIIIIYVTEYWKTDHVRTFGQLLFIGPANSHTHTLPVHCCINGLS